MNVCSLGHEKHVRKLVDTKIGKLYVYDVSLYKNNPGHYCTGQDATSENLILEGQWEGHDTKVIKRILEQGNRNKIVVDFGCHIGWYSIMAAQLGYTVLAIDGDAENLEVLEENASLHNVDHLISTMHVWVDENTAPFVTDRDIELVKIDLEGNDRWAVKSIMPIIDKVQNLYVEITPAFNGTYPKLVEDLERKGFTAYYPNDKEFDHDFSESQINLRFSR